jgi:hypothetical protein
MRKKAGLNALIVVLAVVTGIYASRKPWMVYREQQQRANEATREMNDAEKSREELQRQAASLDSPLGRETLARKIGYSKQGETPVDVNK